MPYLDPTKAREASQRSAAKWYESHKEKAAENARNWRRRNPKYMLFKAAQRRSITKNTPFSIVQDDIPDVPEFCPIALIPIHFKEERSKGPCDNSPTLDQVDPKLGYVKGNVRVISHKGNRWKSDMTCDDLKRIIQYMENP